jgi:hypothetical protein
MWQKRGDKDKHYEKLSMQLLRLSELQSVCVDALVRVVHKLSTAPAQPDNPAAETEGEELDLFSRTGLINAAAGLATDLDALATCIANRAVTFRSVATRNARQELLDISNVPAELKSILMEAPCAGEGLFHDLENTVSLLVRGSTVQYNTTVHIPQR